MPTFTLKANPSKVVLALVASLAMSFSVGEAANAMAIRGGSFNSFTLNRNDDGSTGQVNIGFDANLFGTTYSQLFVNNNGNVTFDSALSSYTPFDLSSTNRAILAPFFADVDTSGTDNGSLPVTYGAGTVDGRAAFGVNWVDVGYFSAATDRLNSFQLVMIDRGDTGVGNFDFEFNYDNVLWEAGNASSGVNGLGGSSARAGYSNGSSASLELAGSAINGAFLNGGSNSLIAGSRNSNEAGRYLFTVRNGDVQAVPTPAPLLGLIGLGAAAIRKRKGEEATAEA